MTSSNPNQEQIFSYLREAKIIAIVGLSNKETRTSFQIAKFLQDKGYKIIPVNPLITQQTILGEKVYEKLEDIPQKIDIVNIFRRNEYLVDIAKDFIKTNALVFWAQLGIENAEAADQLRKNGKEAIIMNCCIKVELEKMS